TMTDGNPATFTTTGSFQSFGNLTDLYFGQAADDAMEPNACVGVSAIIDGLASGALVKDCTGDPTCASSPDGSVFDAASLACGGFSDISAALIGLHPSDVWVTRLEADLPRSALASDLTLTPDEAQLAVSNWHQASKSIGSPCPP